MASPVHPLRLALTALAPAAFAGHGCGGTVVASVAGSVTGSGGTSSVTGSGGIGGTSSGGTGGTGAADAAPDAVLVDAPSIPCGTQTCGPNQMCVHPCCGGVPPACMPQQDAGGCPPGFHAVPFCSGFPGPACQAEDCTPPPPFCKDIPITCTGQPTCACLPADVCPSLICGFVNGSDVECLCA